jgi:hypothetical protein
MCPSSRGLVFGIYVLSGLGLVVGSYEPFWYGVSGTRECDAVLWRMYCPELKWSVWYGVGGRQLCIFLVGGC